MGAEIQPTCNYSYWIDEIILCHMILSQGDVFLKVHAEDGDKGCPREMRYGIVSEGNPFTPFFNIDQKTGRPTSVLKLHSAGVEVFTRESSPSYVR
jgi:hypothetical protein